MSPTSNSVRLHAFPLRTLLGPFVVRQFVVRRGVIAWVTLAVCFFVVTASVRGEEFKPPEDVRALLEKHCFDCHGFGGEEGGLALDELLAAKDLVAERDRWVAVWKNLRAQLMPPADQSQPSSADRARLLSWIETDVFQVDPKRPDPGRVTIRRLNRQEYQNTIQDLLGVRYNVRDAFPADDTGYGFDTIGDVLSISPLLLEKYLDAAREIVEDALPGEGDVSERIFPDGQPPEAADQRDAYRRRVLERLASRAYRRPVDAGTLDRLVELAAASEQRAGGDFREGISQALVAVLASPRFLFRAEIQPQPDDPQHVVPLDEFALASRLSYFLWSSLPDDELFELARAGKLRANLRQQVERMIADPKSERMVENFVGQWLQTRDVETINVDARRVLGLRTQAEANKVFSRRVRRAMRAETELLFAGLLREGGSALDLLVADYTYLNQPLAEFYGIEGVRGDDMQRVELKADDHRGGILTHGSVLLVTSNPTRTSPVKRGLFILDNVLGTPAPPPPADVPELEEAAKGQKKKLTMRQLMEIHRREPLCASCHARMDPLGLALEPYDALGRYRQEENGQPIETAGKLITGESFTNVRALGRVFAAQRRQAFYRCLSEKLLTYALGRGVEYYDAPTVDQLIDSLEQNQGSLRELVVAIVESPPFQLRRGG